MLGWPRSWTHGRVHGQRGRGRRHRDDDDSPAPAPAAARRSPHSGATSPWWSWWARSHGRLHRPSSRLASLVHMSGLQPASRFLKALQDYSGLIMAVLTVFIVVGTWYSIRAARDAARAARD